MSEFQNGMQVQHVEQAEQENAEQALGELEQEQGASDYVAEKEAETAKDTQQEGAGENYDKFASKFAALSRQERKIKQRESEIERRAQELEQRLAELEKPKEEAAPEELPLEYRLKKNPIETLAELGIPYDKLTQIALNDGELPADLQMQLMKQELESKYEKELKSMREEFEGYVSEKEKRELEEKHNATIQGFMGEITNYVNDNGDNYELIRATDSINDVYEVIEDWHQEHGEILDIKTAADAVEELLEEEWSTLSKASKLQKKLGINNAEKPKSEQRQPSPTLSNDLSSQVASVKQEDFLSDDESKLKAAQLLKWQD